MSLRYRMTEEYQAANQHSSAVVFQISSGRLGRPAKNGDGQSECKQRQLIEKESLRRVNFPKRKLNLYRWTNSYILLVIDMMKPE